ncbi:MAG: DUF2924 domain-containing protein [Archangium sp.]|nr:DUF2924 domain-containing protein [Archangium sp.]
MAKSNRLEALRLPELQARFKEVVGEASRSPNRKFLVRRIEEALAKQGEAKPRGRFKAMSVEALQAKYLEVVGRPSGSTSKPYLVWKIREAEKGHVPLGPRSHRRREGEPNEMRILPLRLEAGVVDKMDEAWRERAIPNRMEFLRRALGHYLKHLGATVAAEAFSKLA